MSSRLISKNLTTKIYKTIILSAVLYGREAWSLALREEHRLRVSERVLRRIYGPVKKEMTEGWRRRNEELQNIHFTKYY
jgi:hypothetical protein